MTNWRTQKLGWMMVAGLPLYFLLVSAGAEQKYDAMITCGDGSKTFVQDLHVVYAWREMPAHAEGFTTYQPRNKVEQGIWVPKQDPGQSGFELVPFKDLAGIEFRFDCKQLGLSETYQFQVKEVGLQQRDGKRVGYTKGLLSAHQPVLWPCCDGLTFPVDGAGKRLDNLTVMLQGKTKIDGRDGEYVFVFPTPADTAIRSLLQKKQDAFVRLIQLQPAVSSK